VATLQEGKGNSKISGLSRSLVSLPAPDFQSAFEKDSPDSHSKKQPLKETKERE